MQKCRSTIPTFRPKDGPNLCQMWPEFCEWCTYIADNTTVHGLGWYSKINNSAFKVFVFVLCIIILLGLPVIMVKELIRFSLDQSVLSSQDWVKSNYTTYPNITVCHPAYFDGDKLKSKSAQKVSFLPPKFKYLIKKVKP